MTDALLPSTSDPYYQEKLLLTYLQRHFTEEQITDLIETVPLFGPGGLRSILGEIDLEYFCKAYIPEQFGREFGDYARELLEFLKEGIESRNRENRAVVAPRGHGKSTFSSLAIPVWCTVYKKKSFIIFISANSGIAANFLLKCQRALESQQITEDFGAMKEPKRTWNTDEINTSNNVWIICSGWMSGLRGLNKDIRPDLIILDDLEDKNVIASDSLRKKLEEAFRDEIGRLGDYKTDMLYIGTLLAEDSLLAHVIQEPSWKTLFFKRVINFPEREDLWDKWREIYRDISNPNRMDDAYSFYKQNEEEMVRGAVVLWPGKYPDEEIEYKGAYYNVMLDREKFGEESFWKEDQNEPKSSKNRIFKELQYYKPEELDVRDIHTACLTIDPSLGKNGKADYTAFTAMGRHKSNYFYVLKGEIKRISPKETIKNAIRIVKMFPMITHIGIEAVNFQALLVQELKDELAKEELHHISVVEIHSRGNKHNRIVAIEPIVTNGYIKFNPNDKEYNQQILDYTSTAKHDDAPDSLEMNITLMRSRPAYGSAPSGSVVGKTEASGINW